MITGNWGSDLALLIKAAKGAGLKVDFYTFYAGVVGAPTAGVAVGWAAGTLVGPAVGVAAAPQPAIISTAPITRTGRNFLMIILFVLLKMCEWC